MNLAKAVVENLPSDIAEARQEAATAMARYVDARRRLSELEALSDLQRAMSADDGVTAINRTRPEAA
jgi:hypothetical protein